MHEILLLSIGALFGLGSSVITQLVIYALSRRRDKDNWQRDEMRRDKEKLEIELSEFKSKRDALQKEIDRRKRQTIDVLIYGITLMNQRRDALLGFNQDEQHRRADQMRDVLSKLSEVELIAIKEEKKPLPELPGKPKSLAS